MSVSDLIKKYAETVTVTRYEKSVQIQKLIFDADFVTGNKINMDVDGIAITEVLFAVDHDTTLAQLAIELQSMSPIATATVTGPREITLTAEHEGNEFLVSGVIVTGGASQPSGSITGITGGYVDGVYQSGSTTQFDIEMSVQPLSGKELQLLPEGQRTRRYMKGYTATQLYTADQAESKKADLVSYDGTVFEVQKVERWRGDLNHFKVMMAEVNS